MTIETAVVAEFLPTKVWVESDLLGSRHVVVQYQGFQPFTYASFYYHHAYTSNSGTYDEAHKLARSLGAPEPVDMRNRGIRLACGPASAETVREKCRAADPTGEDLCNWSAATGWRAAELHHGITKASEPLPPCA